MDPKLSREIVSFLQKTDLFALFTDAEIESLLPFIQLVPFHKGEWVFREKEVGEILFLIRSGSVEVLKEEKELQFVEQLAILGPGEWFGEMAQFEKKERSASVRALESVETITIALKDLEQRFTPLYEKILNQVAQKISERLRRMDENLILSLKDKLRLLIEHERVGKILVYLFLLLAIWFTVFKLLHIFPTHQKMAFQIVAPLLFGFIGYSLFYLVRVSGYAFSFYGITLEKGLSVAWNALLVTLPLLLLLLAFKWVLISFVPVFKHLSLFSSAVKEFDPTLYVGVELTYLATIPFQEIILRGFFQTCFHNFFLGPHRVFLSILTSNLVFEMVHTVNQFWLAIATFLLGLFWGYLFEKQRSVVGVSLSHLTVAAWAYFVLDYQIIFQIVG